MLDIGIRPSLKIPNSKSHLVGIKSLDALEIYRNFGEKSEC